MAKLRRRLHELASAGQVNEDWWDLVFDTKFRRFYVEYRWSHANIYRASCSKSGSAESEINAFLAEASGPARLELVRLLESLFSRE